MSMFERALPRMKKAAIAASERAYCPYSEFRVGAAVLTAHGQVFAGCNIENASYGLTICAERTALFEAVASGHLDIVGVVIYTPTESPVAPCGGCRQVIQEFGPDAGVYCFCRGDAVLHTKLTDLLPVAFGPDKT